MAHNYKTKLRSAAQEQPIESNIVIDITKDFSDCDESSESSVELDEDAYEPGPDGSSSGDDTDSDDTESICSVYSDDCSIQTASSTASGIHAIAWISSLTI